VPQQSSPALPLAFGALVVLCLALATRSPTTPNESAAPAHETRAAHPSLPKPVHQEQLAESARGRHDDARCRPDPSRAERSRERCAAGPNKRSTPEAGGPFGALARAMQATED
jgi:hypothetical protein